MVVGREREVSGARIVPLRENRIAEGAMEMALLAGW
jgi:hypothetical protein